MVDPYAYVQANVMGHLVLLEMARRLPSLRHIVYASTSSVYGANTVMPFRVVDYWQWTREMDPADYVFT